MYAVEEDDVALPYADAETGRTSGWSGSDTSAERAHRQDTDGTTVKRQAQALGLLWSRGARGVTWAEVSDYFGWHHGTSSGMLSNLHKAGKIARLEERRNRCKVYVLPDFVMGRTTERQGRR